MATGSNSAASSFSLRRATPADLPRLSALLERYYTEWNVLQRDSPQRIGGYLNEPSPFGFIVAEESGALGGCVLLRALPSIASATECKRLYVVPHLRGYGLASQLMDYAESLAASNHLAWIYLDTADEFTAAQSLYRRRGYDPCERFNDNPQATFFFRKQLAK